MHVRTSHAPRFEIEIGHSGKASLFEEMGVKCDEFRHLPMKDKMGCIRAYARKIHPDGRLWWIGDKDEEPHTAPAQARLYINSKRKN